MHYWTVRPHPHGKDRLMEFVNGDLIAVGWPLVPDLRDIEDDERLESILEDSGDTNPSRSRATLRRFSEQIGVGDIVIVPHDDDISFAEVTGEYHYDKAKATEDEGYPHQRPVTWVGQVSRDELPDRLRNGLRAPMAVFSLDDYEAEIREVLGLTTSGRDIAVENLVQVALETLKREMNSNSAETRLQAAEIVLRLSRQKE